MRGVNEVDFDRKWRRKVWREKGYGFTTEGADFAEFGKSQDEAAEKAGRLALRYRFGQVSVALDGEERLVEIGDDVFDVFDTDGETDQTFSDADALANVLGH